MDFKKGFDSVNHCYSLFFSESPTTGIPSKVEAEGKLEHGYDNPTFTADEAELKAMESQHKEKGRTMMR